MRIIAYILYAPLLACQLNNIRYFIIMLSIIVVLVILTGIRLCEIYRL